MTDDEQPFENNGLKTVEHALAFGGGIFERSEDFDAAIDHVLTLLTDAVVLFERESFGSAAFFAITAMEETAKAHVGSFRRDNPGPRPKGRDPFRDHTAKHSMAILPTVFMSERIVDALGRDRANALEREAQETGFTVQREAGLYCACGSNGFETPRTAVPACLAWELSMLAIEAADDALVGYTKHSYKVGKEFESLFGRLLAHRPPG
jgi:AbiV family abortive infection protein